MGLIVQKYGGTSVANLNKIRSVANNIISRREKGDSIVAVVSAMAGETDRLVKLAKEIMDPPDERELDVITSSGEQVSSGLLAITLKSMGHDAVSFQGHQIRILTDNVYSRAKIRTIDDRNIKKALSENKVVIVAGFQGVDDEGSVTTLGRGGSDLTAVALAAVLKADSCELYKDDVDGIYTTDPSICANACKLEKVSYEEMLEMASLGSKVHVKPTYNPSDKGTWVVEEEESMDSMENIVISGVAYDRNQAKITVVQVPDKPGIAARLFTPLADKGIIVDMIVQNVSKEGHTDMTFTVPKEDYKNSLQIVQKIAKELNAREVDSNDRITKISLVGVGMKTHSGVASQMFQTLAAEGVNIMMISTSEIKISCVVEDKYTELAVRALHDAFKLGDRNG